MNWVNTAIERVLGIRAGGSTGTNLFAAYQLAVELKEQGKTGSIVTMLCDRGDRYSDSYYNTDWLEAAGYKSEMDAVDQSLVRFYEEGTWAFRSQCSFFSLS